MKKFLRLLLISICFLWFFYLLLPPPSPLPSLPASLKSDEPGDTWQIPGIEAYYTDLTRDEVIHFYQSHYSSSSLFNIPLVTYRLDHPPEYAKQLIRQTQQASFFEEIVHPMRESLFVNGYEWQNDPFTKPDRRAKNKMIVKGKEYNSKITLIKRESSQPLRISVSFLVIVLGIWIVREMTGMVKENAKNIKNFSLLSKFLQKDSRESLDE